VPIVRTKNTGDSLQVLTVSALFTSDYPSCGIIEYSLVKEGGESYTSTNIALIGESLEINTNEIFNESVLVQAKT
jgi:hypothetical protein